MPYTPYLITALILLATLISGYVAWRLSKNCTRTRMRYFLLACILILGTLLSVAYLTTHLYPTEEDPLPLPEGFGLAYK
jgi:hypothetical protein